MNWKVFLFLALVGYGAYQHFSKSTSSFTPGETPPNAVMQTQAHVGDIQFNGFTLTPLTDYIVEARVLSREDYSFGTEAELSPTDLALGWGPMSSEAVLSKIKISQSNRFYYWQVEEFPIPRREIEIHSANTHIIPANDMIKRQLETVRKGQIVKLKGQLVEAKRADGWHWRSSLSREDTGNGACEVMYVTELHIK